MAKMTPPPDDARPTVVWHKDQSWGTEAFRIGGRLYRRAKACETAKVVEIQTRYGVARLRPLSQKELGLLEGPK